VVLAAERKALSRVADRKGVTKMAKKWRKERLEKSIGEVAKLRDRKNTALKEGRNSSAKNLLLRGERNASVAKRKAIVELLEELRERV
jgi:hypothetical protein